MLTFNLPRRFDLRQRLGARPEMTLGVLPYRVAGAPYA